MSHIIIQDSENGISVKVGSIFNGFFKKGVLLADSDANNKISITDTSSNTTICRNFPPAEIKTHLGATWSGDGRSAVDVKNALNLVINATPESFINSTDNLTALAGTTEADFNGSTGGKEGFTAVVGANDGEISTSGKLLFANHDNLKLGADLDVSIKKLYTTSVNGDITLEPNGTGDVNLGNYTLDGDQSVGAGQDNYVLTYNHSAAKIGLEAATVAADTDGLTEGSTNLYFTDTRVAANPAVTANTAKNSYPTADSSKLAGISAGAEVNVNADWNAASGDAQILNKPSIPANTNLGNSSLTASLDIEYDQDGWDLAFDPNGGAFQINDTSGLPGTPELQIGQGNVDITGTQVSINGIDYPAVDGSNGQVLTTNGSGALSFTTVSGSGSTTSTPTATLGASFSQGSSVSGTIDNFISTATYVAAVYNSGGAEQTSNPVSIDGSGNISFTAPATIATGYELRVFCADVGELRSATLTKTFAVTQALSFEYWRLRVVDSSGNESSQKIALVELEYYTGQNQSGTETPTTNATSNTSISGVTISAGHTNSSYPPWKAFDGIRSGIADSAWTIGTNAADNWIQIGFSSAQTFQSLKLIVNDSFNDATHFKVLGSPNGNFSGEETTVLDTTAISEGSTNTSTTANF